MVKIIHCADIHIGSADTSLGLLAQKRRLETLMTFERIIDTARENAVQIIALSGDLFDSNDIERSLSDAVFEKIASIPEIKVIYAAGNHDPLNSCSPFLKRQLPENLYVFKTSDDCITFDDLKVRVYGKSFENCYQSGNETFSITPPQDDYVNLMVIHGELKSDINSNYNAITPTFVKTCGMDYIALGHVHKRSEIGKMGDTYFAYCGCPEGQGFDETDAKGIYIGEIGKGTCNLEFLEMAKRKHIVEKFTISNEETSDEIAANILSILSEKYGEKYFENLYKIEISGEVEEDFSLPKEEICERLCEKVFFAKIKDLTQPSLDLETLSKEPTLKGLFVKNMLEKISNAADEEKADLEGALLLGLKAFKTEVSFSEN